MKYDVIIIGAGSMGAAAGYFLAKEGKKTLMIDSFHPPHSKGSHHGETRIIRHAYGGGEQYSSLALRAQELWYELEKETNKELFLKTGVLNVGEKQSDYIQNVVKSAQKYKLPIEMLNPTEVRERWQNINLPDQYVACFEPTSGVLKSEACVEAYHELANKNGASFSMNTRVNNIKVNDGEVTVDTDRQTFYAKSLIISAGAWSGELLEMLELDLPLTPIRKTFAWFDVNEKQYSKDGFPAFAFETDNGLYYGFPSIDGAGLKVGRNDGGEKVHPDGEILPFGEVEGDQIDLQNFLNQYMNDTGPLREGKTCMYTLTPDEHFILDLHPRHKNIAIASGFSGHGFKFSSVVGEILKELIIEEQSKHNIKPFAIERFYN